MFAACVVTGTVSFVAGIIFSKTLLNEASAVKSHVSEELQKLRGEMQRALADLRTKL